MNSDNPLTQKVNFVVSVVFLGSTCLLALVTIFKYTNADNPIADVMASEVAPQSVGL